MMSDPLNTIPIGDALRQAIDHHQAGRLQEAELLYCSILQANPALPEANYGLGLLARQIGNPEAGLHFLKLALAAAPAEEHYVLSCAEALLAAAQVDAALAVIDAAQDRGLDGRAFAALREQVAAARGPAQPDAAAHPKDAVGVTTLGAVKPTKPAGTHRRAPANKATRRKAGRSGVAPVLPPAEGNRAAALFNAGRYAEAEGQCRDLVSRYPDSGFGWNLLGACLHAQGKDALPAFERAVALLPGDAEALCNLGIARQGAGRLREATQSYRAALALESGLIRAHFNLGNALQELGEPADAAASYRRAIALAPDFADAHNSLGGVLQALGEAAAAAASCREAIRLRPDFAEAHNTLATAQFALGDMAAAADSCRRALALKPDFAAAHNNLGNVQGKRGDLAEAESCFRHALALAPRLARAHSNLGEVLHKLGQHEDAAACCRQALELQPRMVAAHTNLGNALLTLGKTNDAVEHYLRAIEADPSSADAYNSLGVARRAQHPAEAIARFRQAIALRPDYADAHNNLGITLLELSDTDGALASLRRALTARPLYAQAHSNLLFFQSHDPTVGPEALFAEHRAFGEKFEGPLHAHWPELDNTREPERRLQVGIVSADLRNHAIAYFLEPVLAELATDPGLALHAYCNHHTEDAVTQRLRGHTAHWHRVFGLDDDALAAKIRADRIDLLIDLSGHTAGNRLLTFARKPAPVQLTWMGYPGTTGLTAIDYLLTDRHFLPPGEFDDQFTEKLVLLPASAPFLPSAEAPEVVPLPALRNGFVTFGSFNRGDKVTPAVVALWSGLLRALPDARMLLAGRPGADADNALAGCFEREGVARSRLRFEPRCSMDAYLGLHGQVDVCLDTWPYNGGTTTLHAAWMGVPTLNLAGRTPASRVGACIQGHLGLEAFVADDPAAFVRHGVYWASHLDELAQLRGELRQRFARSAIGQPGVIAAGLRRALRMVWQNWCKGAAAAAIDVSAA